MPDSLYDYPDWVYLLREFDRQYRHGSAGGSKPIRSHRKRVRDRLSAILDANPPFIQREARTKPVVGHLGRTLDLGADNCLRGLSKALARVSDALTWEYGYSKMPKPLANRYAYAEVVGPRGPVKADSLILGFVLFSPNTTYPQHSHKNIEESYLAVAGAWSENDYAAYSPGSLILNIPGQAHRITTGQLEPCLLAYAWVGPTDCLSAPEMKFSMSKRNKD